MTGSSYAVILAGGKGERFWPLSTSRRPKQLLSLVGRQTLLAQAVDRLGDLIPPERVFVVTGETLVEASRRAVPGLPPEQVVGEPVGRDTAAAIALGAALVRARDPKAVFCVLTADHVIGDLELFRRSLRGCLALAEREDVLVTLGIRPAGPSTAYGYIEAGDRVGEAEGIVFRRARRFVEKPNADTAAKYVASGDFFWNSGMFVWSVRAIEAAFKRHRPQLAELVTTMCGAAGTPAFPATLHTAYAGLDRISIDYAVMEKADNIVMAEGRFAWDDVGSWTALENHFLADPDGNILVGDTQTLDASGNIVLSDGRLTALLGVRDLIVVQAEGATLVCPKARAQDVKKLVEKLRQNPRHRESV